MGIFQLGFVAVDFELQVAADDEVGCPYLIGSAAGVPFSSVRKEKIVLLVFAILVGVAGGLKVLESGGAFQLVAGERGGTHQNDKQNYGEFAHYCLLRTLYLKSLKGQMPLPAVAFGGTGCLVRTVWAADDRIAEAARPIAHFIGPSVVEVADDWIIARERRIWEA